MHVKSSPRSSSYDRCFVPDPFVWFCTPQESGRDRFSVYWLADRCRKCSQNAHSRVGRAGGGFLLQRASKPTTVPTPPQQQCRQCSSAVAVNVHGVVRAVVFTIDKTLARL